MSYAKLRGKIKEVCGTQDAFAAAIKVNAATVSAKLTGRTEWSRKEMELAAEVLSIPNEELHKYFFCN